MLFQTKAMQPIAAAPPDSQIKLHEVTKADITALLSAILPLPCIKFATLSQIVLQARDCEGNQHTRIVNDGLIACIADLDEKVIKQKARKQWENQFTQFVIKPTFPTACIDTAVG